MQNDLPPISSIKKNLLLQDNRITSHPIFIVQRKRKIYGVDKRYTEQFEWVSKYDGSFEYDESYQNDTDSEQIGYIEIWEFVTSCFTERGCKDYITVNGHNLGETRIYVESGYRNYEWQAIRELLMKAEESVVR